MSPTFLRHRHCGDDICRHCGRDLGGHLIYWQRHWAHMAWGAQSHTQSSDLSSYLPLKMSYYAKPPNGSPLTLNTQFRGWIISEGYGALHMPWACWASSSRPLAYIRSVLASVNTDSTFCTGKSSLCRWYSTWKKPFPRNVPDSLGNKCGPVFKLERRGKYHLLLTFNFLELPKTRILLHIITQKNRFYLERKYTRKVMDRFSRRNSC